MHRVNPSNNLSFGSVFCVSGEANNCGRRIEKFTRSISRKGIDVASARDHKRTIRSSCRAEYTDFYILTKEDAGLGRLCRSLYEMARRKKEESKQIKLKLWNFSEIIRKLSLMRENRKIMTLWEKYMGQIRKKCSKVIIV